MIQQSFIDMENMFDLLKEQQEVNTLLKQCHVKMLHVKSSNLYE